MATHTVNRESFATRLGQSLGRGVGSMLRVERTVWSTLSRAGLPGVIVTPVKWLARTVVVVGGAVLAAWGLLYVLAVVAMVAIVVGLMTNTGFERAARGSQLVHFDEEDEVYGAVKRHGPQGYGWYVCGARVE